MDVSVVLGSFVASNGMIFPFCYVFGYASVLLIRLVPIPSGPPSLPLSLSLSCSRLSLYIYVLSHTLVCRVVSSRLVSSRFVLSLLASSGLAV